MISRAEAFLPRLAASNADLARRAALDPTSVDIEHLGENSDGSHIEMVIVSIAIATYTILISPRHLSSLQNLGLGVFEQRPRPDNCRKNKNGQPQDSSSDSSSDSEDSESSEGDDSEDSGDSKEGEDTPNAARTIKKTDILVLSSNTNATGG